MIEIFEGRLGGGKSYSAVLRIAEAVAAGRSVYTNVEVKVPQLLAYLERKGYICQEGQIRFLTGEQIAMFHEHVPAGTDDSPVLVVVDEAHIWMDQRSYQKKDLNDLFFFLTQSRKQNTDIIFISQHRKNMDCRISRLIQYCWTFRDMRKWKFPVLQIPYPFPHLLQCCWDYAGGEEPLIKRFHRWDSGIFECYNTDAMLSHVQRAGVVGRTEVQRVPWRKRAMKKISEFTKTKMYRILLLLLPLMLLTGVYGVYRGWKSLPGNQMKPSGSSAANPLQTAPEPGVPSRKKLGPTIYRERLVSLGGKFGIGKEITIMPLETEMGEYTEGELCAYGLVKRIRGRTVFIEGYDKEQVIVIATRASRVARPGLVQEQLSGAN